MKSLQFQKSNRINVYPDGSYDLVLGEVGIYRCQPALDGVGVEPKSVRLHAAGSTVTASYVLEGLELHLTFSKHRDHLLVQTRITGNRRKAIESVCLFQKASLTGYEKVLAHGYFSWDQSSLISAVDLTNAESHGCTAILGPTRAAILGFLTHDRMMQFFDYSVGGNQSFLTCQMVLEGKKLTGLREIEFADMVVFTDPSVDAGQAKWARMTARAMGVKLDKPPMRGWCSWYYNYFWMTGELVEEYCREFKPYKKDLNLDVFVIDANWFSNLGDWLEPNDKYPKGMQHYAKVIEEAGYIPGIWVGPWMVSDRSLLFREHPEWLCHDTDGNLIEFMSPLGEDNVWGYRGKIHYCLDTSHPGAFAYLRKVFRTLRGWGYRYFKTDFMYWGAMDRFEGGWYHEGLNQHNYIPDKEARPVIKRARPGKTRVEYFVDVLRMIRAEIGPDSIWLGCGQPIWSSVGFVDCMRVSRDVGARWTGANSPKELLNDLALRNFTNRVLYEVDPDCVLLRHFEHKLTDEEVTSLALFMGVSQGVLMTSDPVHECTPARRELFKFIQSDPRKIEFLRPMLGRSEDVIIYVGHRKDSGLKVLFAFNPGEETIEKALDIEALGLPMKAHVCEWQRKQGGRQATESLTVKLKSHQSRLFYLQPTTFRKGWQPRQISG